MRPSALSTIRAHQAVQAGYAMVSAAQVFTPAEQVAGIAVVFNEMAERLGVSVAELLDKARRIAAQDDTFFQREVKALRDYIDGELRK